MNGQLFVSATDARNDFFNLLEKAKKGPYPINITIKGIPEVILMAKDDYDSWLETIETLSDPELMASLKQSEKDLKAGRYSSLAEVEKELGLDYVSDKPVKLGQKGSKKTR